MSAVDVAAEPGTEDVRVLPVPTDFTDAVHLAFSQRPRAFLAESMWQH